MLFFLAVMDGDEAKRTPESVTCFFMICYFFTQKNMTPTSSPGGDAQGQQEK